MPFLFAAKCTPFAWPYRTLHLSDRERVYDLPVCYLAGRLDLGHPVQRRHRGVHLPSCTYPEYQTFWSYSCSSVLLLLSFSRFTFLNKWEWNIAGSLVLRSCVRLMNTQYLHFTTCKDHNVEEKLTQGDRFFAKVLDIPQRQRDVADQWC